MSTTFEVGDYVEATKGRDLIRGYVRKMGTSLTVTGRHLTGLEALGWTVTTLEKAAPPLPTEPGWYSAREARQSHMGDWHTDNAKAFCLNSQGNWVDVGWGGPSTLDGPFTRLEPIQVTVQKVIDYLTTEGCTGWLLNGIRKHFGVTS